MGSSCIKCVQKIQSPKIESDVYGKAKSFRLFSIRRPHMRSFHSSWFSFFVAFATLFVIQPLLPTIRKELGLSKVEVAYSGTASIAATIVIRIVVGPLCDRFGPKRIMSGLLLCGGIPMAFAGLVRNATGLIILRLFVGILGGTFVPCQVWTTAMFTSSVVGTANALVAGWGNLGGGFTFILIPFLLKHLKICGAHEFLAWKIAVAIPAFVCATTGISILFTSDDSPHGEWDNRKLPRLNSQVYTKETKIGQRKEQTAFEQSTSTEKIANSANSKSNGYKDVLFGQGTPYPKIYTNIDRFWIFITVCVFIIQYGVCFGVKISINTVLNLYFLYKFKKDECTDKALPISFSNITMATNVTESPLESTTVNINKCSVLDQNTASLIVSLFGLMNLFARALGGIMSDAIFRRHGISGRLLVHFLCIAFEGVMLLIFSQMETIPSAIAVMVFLSLFVQMSEGTTYAIVPYILPLHVGAVAGIVGASGNGGALIWTNIWSLYVDVNPSQCFFILGIVSILGSLLTFLTVVQDVRICHILRKEKSYVVA